MAEPRRASRGLGTLETQLMDILWGSTSELSVQGVCDALGPGHNYKTVMTVLNRLVEKTLLDRQLDGRAYRYHPHDDREHFLRAVADEIVHSYLESYGNDSAAHLASAIGTSAPSAGAPAAGGAAPSAPRPEPRPAMAGGVGAEDKRGSLAVIVAIAAALQVITFLLRGKRRD
jgi:predicted transcriptional regulator